MKVNLLVSKVEAAKLAIAKAQSDLEAAINEIRVAPRAEKIALSDVLEDAFEKLRAAKAELLEIEALLIDRDK